MKLLTLTLIILLFGCTHLHRKIGSELCMTDNFKQKIEHLSFADPDKLKQFNGRFIEINGIFHHYFEDSGLYPSTNSDSKNALWLMRIILPDSLLEYLNKKEVKVIGRVNTSSRGHFSGYLASLDSVFCIQEISE